MVGSRIATLLGITALSAIAIYLSRQVFLLYNATFKKQSVKVKNISLTKIDVTVYAEITNKSDISAQIINQHYNIYFNDAIVSTIDIKEKVHINSNGSTILPIHIEFNPKQAVSVLFKNLDSLFGDKSKATIKISGWLSLKAGAIQMKNYPVEISYTLQELIDAGKENKDTTTTE